MNEKFSFEIESGTYVRGSCSVQFNGDFYIYGGADDGAYRQVANVVDCSLKTVDTLSFDHYFGEISSYQLGTHEFIISIMIPNRVKNY